MKNLTTTLALSLMLFLINSCNEKESPVKKDISLSRSELLFDKQDDSVKTITVVFEGSLNLDNQPEWLNLQLDQNKKKIEASVKPNHTRQPRVACVKIFDDYSESYLLIKQLSEVEEKEPFSFIYLPNSGVNSFTASKEGGKTVYHFKASDFSVNQNIKNEIYLGNILNSKFTSFNEVQTFKDYLFFNVTVLANEIINGKLYIEEWKTPSKLQMDHLAQTIIKANPKQNQSFSTGSPVVYRSYKYLHFLSMANLGFGIDTYMHEVASPDRVLKKDIGLIYSYNQSLFTLILDYSSLPPDQRQREETDFIVKNNLSYISNVTYGKTAFLIVEADGSKTEINSLINKVFRKEKLLDSEKSCIKEMDIYHLYFSQDGTLQKDSSADNIEKIMNYTQIEKSNIIPLNFSVADYVHNGVREIEYTLPD